MMLANGEDVEYAHTTPGHALGRQGSTLLLLYDCHPGVPVVHAAGLDAPTKVARPLRCVPSVWMVLHDDDPGLDAYLPAEHSVQATELKPSLYLPTGHGAPVADVIPRPQKLPGRELQTSAHAVTAPATVP